MSSLIEDILKINPDELHSYSTGLLQGKAYRVLNASITKVLLQYDLSIPEWKLLGQLFDHGVLRLADLSERLNVEPPLVTSLIDKLEKKKFVRRENHPHDKRAKVITITHSGTELIKMVEAPVKGAMALLLKGVTREQLMTYITVLQTIVNNSSR